MITQQHTNASFATDLAAVAGKGRDLLITDLQTGTTERLTAISSPQIEQLQDIDIDA